MNLIMKLHRQPEFALGIAIPVLIVGVALTVNHLWGFVFLAFAVWTLPRALRQDKREREVRDLMQSWEANG